MSIWTSVDQSNGESCEFIFPKIGKGAGWLRPVIFLHGAGGWAPLVQTPDTSPFGLAQRLAITALIETGRYVVVNPAAGGGQTWGNDASLARVTSQLATAQATTGYPAGGGSSPRFAFLALSMGNITACNWLRANGLTRCAGVVAISPACDLGYNRGTDAAPGTFYSAVNSAYGITTDAQYGAIKATRDPELFAATSLSGLRWLAYSNSDDTVEPTSYAVTLAAAIGAQASVTNSGTGGHYAWNVTGAQLVAALESLPWGSQ